jgi:hypothetical protein
MNHQRGNHIGTHIATHNGNHIHTHKSHEAEGTKMTLLQLIQELKRKDVRLWLEGGEIRFSYYPSKVPDPLRETFKASITYYKSAIVDALVQTQQRRREG